MPTPDPNSRTNINFSTDTNDTNSLRAYFIGQDGTTAITIDNWTEFNLERDFFIAPDGFTLVLEDDRAPQLYNQIFEGMAVVLIIVSGSATFTFMLGYIFSFLFEYDKTGHGQKLTIKGQDLLGWMQKSVCLPNLGNTATTSNFHFKENTLMLPALQTIFDAFTSTKGLNNVILQDFEDKSSATLGTGGQEGLHQNRTAKGRGISKSLLTSLNHLLSPNPDETYLAYATRISKHWGQEIKMQNGTGVAGSTSFHSQTVEVTCPTYNLDGSEYTYSLYCDPGLNSAPSATDLGKFNVLTGSVKIDMESQSSVIIVEKATSGNNTYYQSSRKCVIINELVAYSRGQNSNIQSALVSDPNTRLDNSMLVPFPEINNVVTELTQKYNYLQIQTNFQLYSHILGIFTKPNTFGFTVASPKYTMDLEAHTDDELKFAACKLMAEEQDKFMVLNYSVVGFSQKNNVWTTNRMCYVKDTLAGIEGFFWIKKVNFTLSKHAGAITHLELTLPYTHLGLEPIKSTGTSSAQAAITKKAYYGGTSVA